MTGIATTTLDSLWTDFCDEVDEATTNSTLKARFQRWANRLNRKIQPFAGIEKVWSVTVVANTESYSAATTSMTDFFSAWEGRFLQTGTTDILGNYTFYEVLEQYDYGATGPGFWHNQDETLIIRPRPSVAGTLKVYGYKLLTTLDYTAAVGAGETDKPEIDEDLIDIYIAWATMRYATNDEDTNGGGSRYAVAAREYEEYETELRRRFIVREANRNIARE